MVHTLNLTDEELLSLLPPLEKLSWKKMWGQPLLCAGCMVLFHVVGGLLLAYTMSDFSSPALELWLAFAYGEAMIAVTCLIGMLWGDPGVVHRSQGTCLPIPDTIAEALQGRKPFPTENIQEGESIYCVRCFVWRRNLPPKPTTGHMIRCCQSIFGANRPHGGNFHHCSVCKRCVANFDHHCGFYGRCIAGKGLEGNIIFFWGILFMWLMGAHTCFMGVLVRWSEGKYKWLETSLISFLGILPGLHHVFDVGTAVTSVEFPMGQKDTKAADPAHSLKLMVIGYIAFAIGALALYIFVRNLQCVVDADLTRPLCIPKHGKPISDGTVGPSEVTMTTLKVA